MIGKLIEETEYYSHIDRVLLPGKKRTQVDDLLIRTWIVKGAPKFQRTKYWICITLRAKELAGPPQATYQELALELPIGKDAVRKGCWRMNTGYTLPGVPRYHQHYVRRIPSGEYRLLKKGRRFIDRMDRLYPELTTCWLNELLEYHRITQQLRDRISQAKANYLSKKGV